MNIDTKRRKEQGARLARAREEAGYRSARAAALDNGWPESSYRAHERGTRTIGQDDAERYARRYRAAVPGVSARSILFGGDQAPMEGLRRSIVPVVGYVGAGAEIEPEFEQVPAEGLETIELPFDVPEDIVAFKVKGDSMRPSYKPNDAILVWREQRYATEVYVGEEVAVRTAAGKRFLKELQRGSRRGLFNLASANPTVPLMENAHIKWVGEIYLVFKSLQLRRIEKQHAAASARRARARAVETAGMEELPLRAARVKHMVPR